MSDMLTILRNLLAALPDVSCDNFHHGKADRHEFDEPCKPMRRYLRALAEAQKAVEDKPSALKEIDRMVADYCVKKEVLKRFWPPKAKEGK